MTKTPRETAARPRWYHRVWVVLLMLFVVLGPFGLPLLWKSAQFSRLMKWLLTLATLAYTWWLIVATIGTTRVILQRLGVS